ncbi:MAG: hypothetical protein JXB13_13770 [Phycisphaerae bacterium]|nr:hypothetical protein [Phycisphaerae bacterium]
MITNRCTSQLIAVVWVHVALFGGARLAVCDAAIGFAPPGAPVADGATSQPVRDRPSDLHEDELGVRVGEPLDSGFVFFDGRYLEPPYVVSRRGMAVFINDAMVQPPFLSWPLPVEDPILGASDPPIPDGLARTTSPFDPTVLEYVRQKAEHLGKSLGHNEAIAAMAEAYRSLPCVESARVDDVDSEIVVVNWRDGTSQNVRIFPPTGRRIRWDKPTLIEHLDERCRYWEMRLGKGDVYFFSSEGGPYTGGPSFVEQTFPRILSILRSSESESDKITGLSSKEQIEGTPRIGMPRDIAARLVRTFSAPPQLEQRVARHIERFHRERTEKARQTTQPSPGP